VCVLECEEYDDAQMKGGKEISVWMMWSHDNVLGCLSYLPKCCICPSSQSVDSPSLTYDNVSSSLFGVFVVLKGPYCGCEISLPSSSSS
jgi:hypothetical protein